MATKLVDVAIGVLVDQGPAGAKILIMRRPDRVVYGGYWELPGGKFEPGETPAQCLAREFLEELGLEIAVGAALPLIEHRYEHAHVRLHPFFCTRLAGEPRNLHVAEHRWVGPEELAAYKFPEANNSLIEYLMRTVGANAARSG